MSFDQPFSHCFKCVGASLALFLALGSTDNELKLWSVENGTCLRTFCGHTNKKNFVGLTIDASFIAGGKPHPLYFWSKRNCLQSQALSCIVFSAVNLHITFEHIQLATTLFKFCTMCMFTCLANKIL